MSKKLKLSLVLGFILLTVILLQAMNFQSVHIFNGQYINSKVFIPQPDIADYQHANLVASYCDWLYGTFTHGTQWTTFRFWNGSYYRVECHYDNADAYGYYTHTVTSSTWDQR